MTGPDSTSHTTAGRLPGLHTTPSMSTSAERTTVTLAEDLTMLHDARTGRAIVDTTSATHAIAGAMLLDLTLAGRVVPDADGPRARLAVVDSSPTGEPLLDLGLARLPGKPLAARRAVEILAGRTREPVLSRLAERGLVRPERTRVLGLFPRTTWPAVDIGPATELRARLHAVLLEGASPDQHLALLVSVLHAVKAEHKVVEGPRRPLRERAKQIADGEWAGAAVRKAVQNMQASIAAAVAASAAAGVVASSG